MTQNPARYTTTAGMSVKHGLNRPFFRHQTHCLSVPVPLPGCCQTFLAEPAVVPGAGESRTETCRCRSLNGTMPSMPATQTVLSAADFRLLPPLFNRHRLRRL